MLVSSKNVFDFYIGLQVKQITQSKMIWPKTTQADQSEHVLEQGQYSMVTGVINATVSSIASIFQHHLLLQVICKFFRHHNLPILATSNRA